MTNYFFHGRRWGNPCLVLLGILFSSIQLTAQNYCGSNPVDIHGQLSVNGTKIVDQNNNVVSFAGNSFFWSNTGWGADKYYNANVVSWLKNDWNTTIVRAAMGVEDYGGYLTDPTGNKNRVKAVVDAAIAEGLYVIIDWHSHHAEQYPTEAITFFQEMAQTYGNNPHVIYEIYNEPLQISWSNTIKPYAEQVIAAIRAIDPDNLIIVGTPTWSQDVDAASYDPITTSTNIAYTLHFYAATHKQSLRQKAQTAMNNGIALFVTEWGAVSASGNGAVDYTSTDEWMTFLETNDISHANWSLHDKNEGASVLVPGASSNGGWTASDLTASGTKVKSIVSTWQQHCTGGPVNQLPVVTITDPVNNTTTTVGTTTQVKATASDSDGSINQVEFFVNGSSIGSSITPPYSANFTPQATGSYTITAVATDDDGATRNSSAVNLLVPGKGICQSNNPPVLDGNDNDWTADSILTVTHVLGGTVANSSDLSAEFKVSWDDTYLYVFGKVNDNALFNDSQNIWEDDSFEFYVDGGNEKATSYDANDYQLVFRYNDPIAYNASGGVNNPQGLDFVMVNTNTGYNVEIRASWSFIGVPPVVEGSKIGFNVHVNDDDNGGGRDKFIAWHDDQNEAWNNPSTFGEITFENCQSAFIAPNICLWMEGAYDLNANQMTSFLTQRSLLPMTQPYNTAPWNYSGSEALTTVPSPTVDWVKASFRTDPSKSSEVLAAAAILQEDGCLIFPEEDFFPENLGTSFYVVVEHRNHIGIMSPGSVNVSQGTITYDFRSGDSYANGGQGQKQLVSGVWAMFAGDGDQLQDLNGYDINGIDNASWLPQNGGFNVYAAGDYNLDGEVSGLDRILWAGNNGVYSSLDR